MSSDLIWRATSDWSLTKCVGKQPFPHTNQISVFDRRIAIPFWAALSSE